MVVVGGSSGVGLAIARRASSAGARLTLLARNLTKLETAARTLANAEVRSMDLVRPETITSAIEGIGVVDHLVVTAGTFSPASIAASDPSHWRSILEERLIGPLLIVKLLSPRIASSIVLFSGVISRRPGPGCAVLAAATAGVESAVRALSLELAPVRVNAVAPGMLDTPMLDKALSHAKAQVCAEVAAKLPVRRVGTGDDAAEAALFLMSNSYMSGACIEIDGGSHLI